MDKEFLKYAEKKVWVREFLSYIKSNFSNDESIELFHQFNEKSPLTVATLQ